MRKLIVGLMAVGLLAVAEPAMALDTGMGDPLGLIASGVVLPYVGGGAILPGSQSWLEVSSPVGGNNDFHMFFFDTACVRGPKSVGLPLTANDVELIRIDNADPDNPSEGLITAAGATPNGQNLALLNNPIHARVYWVTPQGFVRVLEPISLDHAEFPGNILSWNPLRSGVSFFAPLEDVNFRTTIYLICPNNKITSHTASNNAVFPSPPFVELVPEPPAGAIDLQARTYDDDEGFLRNFLTSCSCLSSASVTALDAIYADPVNAPFGTYTELESTAAPVTGALAFTGYKAIHVGGNIGPGVFDAFGRLDNANAQSQQGNLNLLTR